MKQALIKKTGEIFDVVSEYSMMNISIELPIELGEKIKDIQETWTYNGDNQIKMTTGKPKEDYYVLSNGETHEVDDLIIGLDDIRDWKLKNDLNI